MSAYREKQRCAGLIVVGSLLALCPLAGGSLELGPLTVRSPVDQSPNADADLAPAADVETKSLEDDASKPSPPHERPFSSAAGAGSSLDNSAKGSATLDTAAVERRNRPDRTNKPVTHGTMSAVVLEPVPAPGVAVAIEIPAPVATDAAEATIPTSDASVPEQSPEEFAEPIAPAAASD